MSIFTTRRDNGVEIQYFISIAFDKTTAKISNVSFIQIIYQFEMSYIVCVVYFVPRLLIF